MNRWEIEWKKSFLENLQKVIALAKIKNKAKFNTTNTLIICETALYLTNQMASLKYQHPYYTELNQEFAYDMYVIEYVSRQVAKLVQAPCTWSKKGWAMYRLQKELKELEEINARNLIKERVKY